MENKKLAIVCIFLAAIALIGIAVHSASAAGGDLLLTIDPLGQNHVISSVLDVNKVYTAAQLAEQSKTILGVVSGTYSLEIAIDKGLESIVGEKAAKTIDSLYDYNRGLPKHSTEFKDIKINGLTGIINSGQIILLKNETKKNLTITLKNIFLFIIYAFHSSDQVEINSITYEFGKNSSLQIGDKKYENIKENSSVKTDKDGNIIKEEITYTVKSTYLTKGNQPLTVLSNTRITYENGAVTVYGKEVKYGDKTIKILGDGININNNQITGDYFNIDGMEIKYGTIKPEKNGYLLKEGEIKDKGLTFSKTHRGDTGGYAGADGIWHYIHEGDDVFYAKQDADVKGYKNYVIQSDNHLVLNGRVEASLDKDSKWADIDIGDELSYSLYSIKEEVSAGGARVTISKDKYVNITIDNPDDKVVQTNGRQKFYFSMDSELDGSKSWIRYEYTDESKGSVPQKVHFETRRGIHPIDEYGEDYDHIDYQFDNENAFITYICQPLPRKISAPPLTGKAVGEGTEGEACKAVYASHPVKQAQESKETYKAEELSLPVSATAQTIQSISKFVKENPTLSQTQTINHVPTKVHQLSLGSYQMEYIDAYGTEHQINIAKYQIEAIDKLGTMLRYTTEDAVPKTTFFYDAGNDGKADVIVTIPGKVFPEELVEVKKDILRGINKDYFDIELVKSNIAKLSGTESPYDSRRIVLINNQKKSANMYSFEREGYIANGTESYYNSMQNMYSQFIQKVESEVQVNVEQNPTQNENVGAAETSLPAGIIGQWLKTQEKMILRNYDNGQMREELTGGILRVYSVDNSLVFEREFSDYETVSWDVRDIAEGKYNIRYIKSGKSFSTKFILDRG